MRWRGGDVPARGGDDKDELSSCNAPQPLPLPLPWISTTPACGRASSEGEASQPSHGEGDRSAAGPPGAPPPVRLRLLRAASACGEPPDLLLLFIPRSLSHGFDWIGLADRFVPCCVCVTVQPSACAAGDSAAYQRSPSFGDDVVVVA